MDGSKKVDSRFVDLLVGVPLLCFGAFMVLVDIYVAVMAALTTRGNFAGIGGPILMGIFPLLFGAWLVSRPWREKAPPRKSADPQ